MLKSPMFVQSLSCVLIEVLRRRLLPLYKVWASSSALGEELVLHAGGLLVGGGRQCRWTGGVLFSLIPIFFIVISFSSRDLDVIQGRTVLFILI
jgi:hypothetical protein